MMDLRDYTAIYKDADRQILVNKSEFNYSLVAKDGDAFTEILVSAEEIDNSMTFPEAEKMSWKKQFELLFGNKNGFDGLIKYCDENEISTQILNWD
ncbi:MAG: hypothetical protein IAB80_04840 [Bacteroidetes bacterium]|uniref:Uncharacterized protein n=1 Tax=Candidatus Cryptobacteroides excrementipullorum TaxID=2840761 RepID=A0A9D9ISW5_9BACT|nr:hypothetical protein [Candidatus Cryptobacteroides excrementipullorum]